MFISYMCLCTSDVLVSVQQLKQHIKMQRRLNWLGTTCAVNGFTAPASQSESSIETDHGMNIYTVYIYEFHTIY